jgi:hypothetical protein
MQDTSFFLSRPDSFSAAAPASPSVLGTTKHKPGPLAAI